MAKENCKHCGKEVGFISQVKLIDGTFICKDCYKKAGEVFHNMVHGYAAYEKLLREQERNDKIYEKILKGQKKSEMFGATSAWYLYCYAGCGLMYFKTERGGFVGIGADKTYNIYRYADLAAYEEIDGNSAVDKRMKDGEPYIHLVFSGDYAVRDVYMPSKAGMYRKLSKYFDECFGLGGKGISGFKKAMQKNKQDIMAIGAMTQGIKSALSGGDQAQAAETITASAQLLIQGDRTEWIQKTETALSGAGIEWNV